MGAVLAGITGPDLSKGVGLAQRSVDLRVGVFHAVAEAGRCGLAAGLGQRLIPDEEDPTRAVVVTEARVCEVATAVDDTDNHARAPATRRALMDEVRPCVDDGQIELLDHLAGALDQPDTVHCS